MTGLSSILFAGSAAIVLGLGTLHLVFTFFSDKFRPRDADLENRLRQVPPVLTRETTMWNAWVGFNASHSMGAMLFGLIYGYLALFRGDWLRESHFLAGLGLLTLLGYVALGWRYWFSVPFRGLLAATVLYAAGLLSAAL